MDGGDGAVRGPGSAPWGEAQVSVSAAAGRALDAPFDLLLVDDDVNVIHQLGALLSRVGQVRFATTGAKALALLRSQPADIVLLDLELPDLSGFEVCRQIKQDPRLADLPVVFVTSHHDPAEELRGLELGAVDFIHKPPSGPLVVARVSTHLRLKRLTDALRHAAATDGLTGAGNRRQFDEVLARELARAQRTGADLALLMLDVDHFKAYNDRHGHVAGDQCLQALVAAMRQVAQRPADLVARYGGEEFALLLPDTDAAGAGGVAEALRQAIAALGLPHGASPVGPCVTVSIGVAALPPGPLAAATAAATLVHWADLALYRAKAQGRHRVVVFDDHTAPWPAPRHA